MSYEMTDGQGTRKERGTPLAIQLDKRKKKHMQIEHARRHLGRHRPVVGTVQ
jgi:hypothetical protein